MSPIFAARRVRGSAKRTPAHIRKKSDKGDIFALCLDLMRSLATLCVAFKLIKQCCAARWACVPCSGITRSRVCLFAFVSRRSRLVGQGGGSRTRIPMLCRCATPCCCLRAFPPACSIRRTFPRPCRRLRNLVRCLSRTLSPVCPCLYRLAVR